MILVADSGTTKSEWGLIAKNELLEKKTLPGINPYLLRDEAIEDIIRQGFHRLPVEEIHFFSAGCGSVENSSRIHLILKRVFPGLHFVEVDSDLLGAALATCHQRPGIVCILGTGSNACVYDGKDIIDQTGGFGYILGDEGSGTILGRSMLHLYLYRKLPAHLQQAFESQFDQTPTRVISRIYREPMPNRFMSQLAPFVYDHRNEPIFQQLLHRHFHTFFELTLSVFEKWKYYPIHLIGSVGWHFQEEIRKVASSFPFEIASIQQRPLDGLIEYFMRRDATI